MFIPPLRVRPQGVGEGGGQSEGEEVFCSYRGKVLDAAISQDESLNSNARCKPRVNFEDDQLRKLLKENKTS